MQHWLPDDVVILHCIFESHGLVLFGMTSGADVNLRDTDGNTALRYATDNHYQDTMQVLQDAGEYMSIHGTISIHDKQMSFAGSFILFSLYFPG